MSLRTSLFPFERFYMNDSSSAGLPREKHSPRGIRFNVPRHKLLLKAVSLEAVSYKFRDSLLVCCNRFIRRRGAERRTPSGSKRGRGAQSTNWAPSQARPEAKLAETVNHRPITFTKKCQPTHHQANKIETRVVRWCMMRSISSPTEATGVFLFRE